jgi:hypothetical protein
VHSTIREATDRGYECLLLEDGVAATEAAHLPGALGTVRCEGGIFGSTAPVEAALAALALTQAARQKTTTTAAAADADAVDAADAANNAKEEEEEEEEERLWNLVTIAGAKPNPFTFPAGKVALLMVDWQGDFCEEGGFGHALGNDCSDAADVRRALVPAAAVLAAARKHGGGLYKLNAVDDP